jgi:hypothetical protein
MSTPKEEEEYRKNEKQWKEIRRMSVGQLLTIKGQDRRDFRQTLVEMALELHQHEENVRADRWLAIWAIIIAGLALLVSALTLCKELGWLP